MVRKIILLAFIFISCPSFLNGCMGAGYINAREPDGQSVAYMNMTFESRWRIEEQPVTCIEDELVPVWNGAQLDAYLLDDVYYRRVKEVKYEYGL